MTVARENRDNPLLYTTMLIRTDIYLYLCIGVFLLLCNFANYMYAYKNVSRICARALGFRESLGIFFSFRARGYHILELTLQNDKLREH